MGCGYVVSGLEPTTAGLGKTAAEADATQLYNSPSSRSIVVETGGKPQPGARRFRWAKCGRRITGPEAIRVRRSAASCVYSVALSVSVTNAGASGARRTGGSHKAGEDSRKASWKATTGFVGAGGQRGYEPPAPTDGGFTLWKEPRNRPAIALEQHSAACDQQSIGRPPFLRATQTPAK